ncbi:MAG: RNA methyltransferase [Flavobacteriaceae bacterium]|nr:RNA methyltransferase [Flavobacteriaceae bacterium]
MVVKSQIKLVKNLQQKKYRNQHGLFVAEGRKTVQEVLGSGITPKILYSTDKNELPDHEEEITLVGAKVLERMSGLKTPNKILGVFEIPREPALPTKGWVIALDGVKDPGNMGTIIRLCDWFGIAHLVCSEDTVDCYNPKVVQATMGSIGRVHVHYTDLTSFVKGFPNDSYGAMLDGTPIQGTTFPKEGVLVMGSESHGISVGVQKALHHTISIQQYGSSSAESLNVATASAIFLHEIRRSQ